MGNRHPNHGLAPLQTRYRVIHGDVIKWKHFPRYWPFVRGIHRSPVNSPHKGQWRGALMFSVICVWINGWVNNRKAGDLRRYRTHYDVSVMYIFIRISNVDMLHICVLRIYMIRATNYSITTSSYLSFLWPLYLYIISLHLITNLIKQYILICETTLSSVQTSTVGHPGRLVDSRQSILQ